MRKPAAPTKPRLAKTASFPAPTGGWVKNQNLATPGARRPDGSAVNGAAMLENFFPLATSIRMRGGSAVFVVVDDITLPIASLFSYINGNNQKMFAANANAIFDVTIAPPQVYFTDGLGNEFVTDTGDKLIPSVTRAPVVVSNLTSGEWNSVQFATPGGTFLDLVNGADTKLIYDGTNFYPISGTDLYAFNYVSKTQPFTVGKTLTGATSAATGTIVKVIDNGTTGTLWINNVSGTFQTAEIIHDNNTPTQGSATSSGTPTLLFGAMTGVDPKTLSYNFVYKQRLFYIEQNSLNAWYLPAASISGAAVQLPLGGVFTRGGSLLFGASWSLETLGGLSAQCIFVTTEGEVAVYQGSDPSVSTSWNLVGVYRIGKPLGPKAWIHAGGDLVIATDIGFVPLSQAVQRDFSALSPSAISYAIETAWNDTVAARPGANWHCAVWPSKQMVLIVVPTTTGTSPLMFAANARTGAWSSFTGWDGTCEIVFQDRLFFGSSAGNVIEAEVGGSDQGLPYTCTCVPLFDPLKSSASLKTGMSARATILSTLNVSAQLSFQHDYSINLPPPPPDTVVPAGSIWGAAIWGKDTWGGAPAAKKPIQQWRSVNGSGYMVSPAVQISSGSIVQPDAELANIDLTYDLADILT